MWRQGVTGPPGGRQGISLNCQSTKPIRPNMLRTWHNRMVIPLGAPQMGGKKCSVHKSYRQQERKSGGELDAFDLFLDLSDYLPSSRARRSLRFRSGLGRDVSPRR